MSMPTLMHASGRTRSIKVIERNLFFVFAFFFNFFSLASGSWAWALGFVVSACLDGSMIWVYYCEYFMILF